MGAKAPTRAGSVASTKRFVPPLPTPGKDGAIAPESLTSRSFAPLDPTHDFIVSRAPDARVLRMTPVWVVDDRWTKGE